MTKYLESIIREFNRLELETTSLLLLDDITSESWRRIADNDKRQEELSKEADKCHGWKYSEIYYLPKGEDRVSIMFMEVRK